MVSHDYFIWFISLPEILFPHFPCFPFELEAGIVYWFISWSGMSHPLVRKQRYTRHVHDS